MTKKRTRCLKIECDGILKDGCDIMASVHEACWWENISDKIHFTSLTWISHYVCMFTFWFIIDWNIWIITLYQVLWYREKRFDSFFFNNMAEKQACGVELFSTSKWQDPSGYFILTAIISKIKFSEFKGEKPA